MNKVVFFDSGVGGITVLVDAMNLLPNEDFVYFADTDNVPYGTKSKEEIKRLVVDAVDFFDEDSIKALVLACNTATSVVINDLRKKYRFPIIGMEPAVKPASENFSKRILVCATERTIIENKLKDLILILNVQDRVDVVSLQSLVRYAENYDFHNEKIFEYLEHSFRSIDWNNYDSLVLGCTHFLFFKTHLLKVIPSHVNILDGNNGTVNRLKALIEQKGGKGSLTFIKSKRSASFLEFDHFMRYYWESQ